MGRIKTRHRDPYTTPGKGTPGKRKRRNPRLVHFKRMIQIYYEQFAMLCSAIYIDYVTILEKLI